MTGGFAGSRSVDERRRRRLATESEDATTTAADGLKADGTSAGSTTVSSNDQPAIRTSDSFPLRKLLSQRVWKLWAVGAILLGVGAGILYFGHLIVGSTSAGPRVRELFDLSHGPMIQFFGCVLMLMAGQFSLLIRWARSCSFTDFDGRYRGWSWIAAAWFCSSFAIATSAHNAWSEAAGRFINLADGSQSALAWLLPLSVCAGWMLWFLHGDMRGCKSSRALLWMAVIAFSAAGAQLANGEIGNDLMLSAAAMAGYLLSFMSMLLHSRHVIHITAEPTKLTTSLSLSKLRIRLPQFRRSRSTTDPVETTPPAETVKAEVEVSPAIERAEDDVATKPPQAPISSTAPKRSRRKKETKSAPADEEELVVPAADSPAVRIDEPIDKADLKGLSKRERRRLRKQRRDQQRQSHGKPE